MFLTWEVVMVLVYVSLAGIAFGAFIASFGMIVDALVLADSKKLFKSFDTDSDIS